jgi:hypothetical protein
LGHEPASLIRADGGDATYWISADELQRGFIEAMARAGAEPAGR